MGGSTSKISEPIVNKNGSSSNLNPPSQVTKESEPVKNDVELVNNKISAPNVSSNQEINPVKNKKFGMNLFRKKDLNTTFTEDYGTSVNMISFIGSVYSRLSYMNEHQFLGHYTKIFGPIIPKELMSDMNNVIKNRIPNILKDEEMFSLKNGEKKFGLDTYETDAGLSLRFLPWAQEINKVNGEQRISSDDANCDIETTTVPNDNLVFATIATSNYGTTYVVGDKRMPNIVNVVFRGTSDAKSAGSYTKPSSLSAMWTGNIKMDRRGNIISGLEKEEDKEKFLYGIYKILIETAHTLLGAIKYVSDKINPNADKGTVNVITTGHSLGGGLATIFAYVYVAHVSNDDDFTNLYPSLNINIGCFTYGSPRVLSKDLARHFCELTTNNENNFQSSSPKESESYKNFISSIKNEINGRITYLRIVSYHDPVTALPKIGFDHPCSGAINNEMDDDSKKMINKLRETTNVDCLVQVDNSLSHRCRGTRLAMTYDFNLPLNCVNSKEKRKNGPKGPLLAKMPMGYHTEYLGISYIGGISLGNVFGKNVKRVNEPINLSKKGDTVCRVLIYPNQNDTSKALVGFYDLSIYRSKSNVESLNIRDTEFEEKENNEKSQDDGLSVEQNVNNVNGPTENSAKGAYVNKTSAIFKNMTGISKIMVEVPEDIMLTVEAFKFIVENSEDYNIINVIDPPLTGNLINITGNDKSTSFEGIYSSGNETNIYSQENKPIINPVGGNKKRNKTNGHKTKRNKPTGHKTKRNKKKGHKTNVHKTKRNKKGRKTIKL